MATRRVGAVLLAAGQSTRFGSPKTMALVSGETLLERACRILASCELVPLVVVVSPRAQALPSRRLPPTARIVVNHDTTRGIGTSVSAGVAALPDDTQAVVVALADQPGLRVELVRQLLRAWGDGSGAIVRPVYCGTPRHPVVFDRRFIPELLALRDNRGGSTVIDRHLDALHVVQVSDRRLVDDVDEPGDLRPYHDGH